MKTIDQVIPEDAEAAKIHDEFSALMRADTTRKAIILSNDPSTTLSPGGYFIFKEGGEISDIVKQIIKDDSSLRGSRKDLINGIKDILKMNDEMGRCLNCVILNIDEQGFNITGSVYNTVMH